MATNSWKGDALAVAQASAATITAYDAGTTYRVTISGKTISTIGTGGTTATTCTALVGLLNASTLPEFSAITWSAVSSAVTGTADTAGTPFTATSSVTGGTGTFGAFADSTANGSPADIRNVTNWTLGIVPIDTHDVIIDGSNDLLYGLDALAAVTLNSLTIPKSFTGKIGLPEENAAGYIEDQPTYLKVGATTVTIGGGKGRGSGRIKLDNSSIQTALTVYAMGTPTENSAGVPAFLWKGTHASNVVNALGGSVGIAFFADEVATVATLRKDDATVLCGTGVTHTTVTNNGKGTLEINSACTTLTASPGSKLTRIVGAGAITTLNAYGPVDHLGTGTITTLNDGSTGNIDFDDGVAPITITNTNLYAKCKGRDTGKRVIFTNAFATPGCGLKDIDWDFGIGRTYLPT